ncbi:hypothetical protein V2J09_004207 [Rumex salicifolius]
MATVKLQSMKLNPITERKRIFQSAGTVHGSIGYRFPQSLLKKKALTLAVYSSEEPSVSQLTSSIGSPSISVQWNITQRHITVLNVAACLTSVSATWLFCSAIPAMLAFKRATESMEKLLDVTKQDLPDTMAAIHLSGMEISDLTTELSDLGHDITRGVRRSTQTVRVANMNIIAPLQVVVSPRTTQIKLPAVAATARGVKEGIRKARTSFQMFFTFSRLSRLMLNYLATQAKQKTTLNM